MQDIQLQCESEAIPFEILDFVVYCVAIWWIFSNMLIGPVIRSKIARPLWLAELGRLLFYYDKNLDNTMGAIRNPENNGQKVKVQLDEGGIVNSKDKVMM